MAAGGAGRRGGFTMIEVMISVAILGIGIAGLASLLGESLRAGELSKRRLGALGVAQSTLEETLQLPYAALPIGTTPDQPVAGWPLFTSRIQVTQVSPAVKGVAVTVLYPDGEARLFGCRGNYLRVP